MSACACRWSFYGASFLPGRAHQWTGLHKGTVLQHFDPGRVSNGLRRAKRYCQIQVIGDTLLQRLGTLRL